LIDPSLQTNERLLLHSKTKLILIQSFILE
jgi:hypothetical protein